MEKTNDVSRMEKVNNAIQNHDYNYLIIETMEHIFEFEDFGQLAMLDFLESEMKKIQENNNYNYQPSEVVKTFTENCNSLFYTVKNNNPDNLKKAKKYFDKARDLLDASSKYFANFTSSNKYVSFIDLFENKQFISKKEELQRRFNELDNDSPLNEPKWIYREPKPEEKIDDEECPQWGEDKNGEIIPLVRDRLEKPEETAKRVQEELNDRQERLKNADPLTLNEMMDFCYNAKQIVNLRVRLSNLEHALGNFLREEKWKDFIADKEFYNSVLDIMAHDEDKYVYLYHGTQDIKSAKSILKTGLGMERPELSSTTHEEFTPRNLCFYSRGFGGEIGKDAVVIIKQPKNTNIVEDIGNIKIPFLPSGLGGLNGKPNYIIKPEHIVGFVNKRDHKVEYGMAYKPNKTRE